MARTAKLTPEEKVAARVRKAEARAARAAAERAEEEQEMQRRRDQLGVTQAASERIESMLRDMTDRGAQRVALHDHLTGFYEEVDKLAKGKAMLEATKLIVDEANQIIKDAKTLIRGDPFLDRVKEFVPAGENPVYPDVLVSLRNVMQALGRFDQRLRAESEQARAKHYESMTLVHALTLFVNEETYASYSDVRRRLGTDNVSKAWFLRGEDETPYFDYERLDSVDLDRLLRTEYERR